MESLKNQKGITLVALVITIIVLLILAGVSLSLVAGEDGILGRATGAVATNAEASAKEEAALLISNCSAEYYSQKYANTEKSDGYDEIGENEIQAYIENEFSTTKNRTTQSGYLVIVDASGNVTVTGKNLKADGVKGTVNDQGKLEWTTTSGGSGEEGAGS